MFDLMRVLGLGIHSGTSRPVSRVLAAADLQIHVSALCGQRIGGREAIRSQAKLGSLLGYLTRGTFPIVFFWDPSLQK